MKTSWYLWAVVVVVAMLAGFYIAQRSGEPVPQLTSGTWFPQPRPIENFALTDEMDQPFTLSQARRSSCRSRRT